MLDFEQVKMDYPPELRVYERAILREYLQHKMLQAIFESSFASRLAFIGGTALRILYGNNRFSEDIDLDHFGLSLPDFENLVQLVKRFLELEGMEVRIRTVAKGAFRCYLRVPDVLYNLGLSPHQEETILIQIDSTDQTQVYKPDLRILNRFDVFTEIRAAPLPILLSQKIYAAVNRKRPKGRDFYDITFLFSKTRPDLKYLSTKLGTASTEDIHAMISQHIQGLDFQALAADVAPFLIRSDQIRRVERFRAFWDQVSLK